MSSTEGLDTPCVGIAPNSAFEFLYGVDITDFEGQTPREIWPQISQHFGYAPNTQLPGGVNRTVRRAYSYAWDYEAYANVAYSGGDGVVCDNPLGMGSIYYENIPGPYTNLTKARQILLNDPYYATILAAKGLSLTNTTDEWKLIGSSNPIKTFKALCYDFSAKPAFIEDSLNSIGFGVQMTLTQDLFGDYTSTGRAVMFDMFAYIWPTSNTDPMGFMGQGMNLLYRSTHRRIGHFSYNYANVANSTIDQLLDDIPFSGTNAQTLYNQLAYDLLNYHSPWIYCGQYRSGLAYNNGWNITTRYVYTSNAAYIGGARKTNVLPEIPAYPLEVLVFGSIISTLGIAYVITKKRKKI